MIKTALLYMIVVILQISISFASTNGCIQLTTTDTGSTEGIIVGPVYNASNAGQLYTSATCKITILSTSGANLVSQASMVHLNNSFYNYTYAFSSSGIYPFFINCSQGSDSGLDSGCAEVGTSADTQLSTIITNQNTAQNSLNRIETGVQDNATNIKINTTLSFGNLNSSLSARFDLILDQMWNKLIGFDGKTFNLTIAYILDNSTKAGAASNLTPQDVWTYNIGQGQANTIVSGIYTNLTNPNATRIPAAIWQYNISSSTVDTNITVNESPQAGGMLFHLFRWL